MPPVSRLVFAALALITIAAPFARADAASAADRVAPVRARAHKIRIAIVGAGPAGLTAAYTLRNLGYERVTVYEKNAQAGGRVYTSTVLGYPIELGAVFASDRAPITLGYANQYGVPYVALPTAVYVLDDDGAVVEIGEFGPHKYGLPTILAAVQKYVAVLETYRPDEIVSMAGLPPELRRPFSEFAESKGFLPLADVVRPLEMAFGYTYYEDVPAMYLLRAMAEVLPVLPTGELGRPTTFGFPGGFQEVFTKLAADLGSRQPGRRPRRPYRFLYNAEVTKVRRRDTGSGRVRIRITANGRSRLYDRLIIATPPSAAQKYLDLTAEESDLLGQVESRNYHVNLSIVLGMPPEKSSLLLLYPNTRPANIGHLNAWDRYGAASVFRTDQNVGWSQSTAEAQQLLVQDFESHGGGTVAGILLHKEWENFAHFGTAALENDAYERLEGLQGKKGTFYATGLMTVDDIEDVSRYARDLVKAHFQRPP